jgi:hypothetical protein
MKAREVLLIGSCLCVVLVIGCTTLGKEQGRIQLPAGDAARGKAAFVDLRCNHCHRVEGVSAPAPVAQPPVPVILGDRTRKPPTREYLAQSILAPSHEFARGYKEDLIKEGKLSRMGDYSDVLTVRQLSDLVAFIESLNPPQP